MIGDDEHGWGEHEPLIYETTRMFGTILKNIGVDTMRDMVSSATEGGAV